MNGLRNSGQASSIRAIRGAAGEARPKNAKTRQDTTKHDREIRRAVNA